MSRRSRTLAALSAAAVVGSLLIAPASTAEPAPEPVTDYCREQCHHILPPGQNGNATFAELVAHMLLGTRPPHSDDQLAKYDRLAGGYSELTTGTIDEFFNDNSFGVRPDDVERAYQPREDVTIIRDKTAGIPHIYGITRSGTAYGAGFATAEDKLFLMDAMRRAGRGEVTPFAGGAPANRQLEQQFFSVSPYTEQELQQQIDTVSRFGEPGRLAFEDAKSYVDGINEYIEKSHSGRYFPGEYVATGQSIRSPTKAGSNRSSSPTWSCWPRWSAPSSAVAAATRCRTRSRGCRCTSGSGRSAANRSGRRYAPRTIPKPSAPSTTGSRSRTAAHRRTRGAS